MVKCKYLRQNESKSIHYSFILSQNFLVVKYLTQLYCVCVVWNNLDANQFVDINSDWSYEGDYPAMIWLKYEKTMSDQTNITDLIQSGIENGCQVRVKYSSHLNLINEHSFDL